MPTYNAAQHFARQYAAVPREFAFRARNRQELATWQRAFRRRLHQTLGLDVLAADLGQPTLKARRLQREDLGDHWRERWLLWVEPDVPLPFYLLIPKQTKPPWPLVLTPHGHNHPHIYAGIAHSQDETDSIRDGERDIARQAVREGYLAIAPTTRAFGDTRTLADRKANKLCSCRTELLHGLLLGRTVIGERVWDIARLIDWALTRGDVDARRIAITGNSAGGTTAVFAAACDRRIAVAVPGSYFCTFAGSIGTIHHCDCNYVPGLLRLGEEYDVAGLIAPRPFCAIAGVKDEIFPIAHVRHAFRKLQQIYRVAGAADRCVLYEGSGGHRYYKAGAWPLIRRHFAAR